MKVPAACIHARAVTDPVSWARSCYFIFFLLVKTEKKTRLKIKKTIIFDITVETWLVLTQQVAKELNLRKAAVLSVQSKLSAEI